MRLHILKQRNTNVQLQMSFLEPLPIPGAAPVWASLDTEQRAEVVAALRRLIAKVANTSGPEPPAGTEEKKDE